MASQIKSLATLAYIDEQLDELKDEYGELPDKVRSQEAKVVKLKFMIEETSRLLVDIKAFCSTAKVTLMELKEREEMLAKKQFLVRNNKEFDAVTNEIKFAREEHERLSDRLRTEGLKEENLTKILAEQVSQFETAKIELDYLEQQIKQLSSEQDKTLKDLFKKRDMILSSLNSNPRTHYNRIRVFHNDVVAKIKRDSCSGCYSSLPKQQIVEIRNNFEEVLFYCENCGRMLIGEESFVDESNFDENIKLIKSTK